jgi:hypothetical protein
MLEAVSLSAANSDVTSLARRTYYRDTYARVLVFDRD